MEKSSALQSERPVHVTPAIKNGSMAPEQSTRRARGPARDVEAWLKEERRRSHLQVRRIAFDESGEWRWDERGFLTHVTGRFFNVVGVRSFSVVDGTVRTQPIIDQPEIGLLCFLVSRRNGEWWILGHAKVEPGNVGGAQLAPTVQATRSNYELAHGGADTPYLNLAQADGRVLCNQLQSEQNSRFLAKRNCNRVVLLPEAVNEFDARFRWMRVRELLSLLGTDFMVNTDARSVLACWLFTDLPALRECLAERPRLAEWFIQSLASEKAVHPRGTNESWLDSLDRAWKASTEVISLHSLGDSWRCGSREISSPDDPSLTIHQIAVDCIGREVPHWDQPIAGSRATASTVLLIGDFNGTLHLLLQAVLEAGNRDGFELSTTIQAESGDRIGPLEQRYLDMAEASGRTLLHFQNSEEGGRFDHCISDYRIVWVGKACEEQEGPFHRWFSLSQFADLLRRGSCITNELRSAVSSLLDVNHVCERTNGLDHHGLL